MLLNITLVSIFTQKLKHILSVLCTYWMPTALTAVSKTQTSRILPKKKKNLHACKSSSAIFYSFRISPSAAIFCPDCCSQKYILKCYKTNFSVGKAFFCTYENLDAVVGSIGASASYIIKVGHWEEEREK